MFVLVEDGEVRFGTSDVAFARAVLPELDGAIKRLEDEQAKDKAEDGHATMPVDTDRTEETE